MKILLPYITLAFFVPNVYSQLVDGDTFLPDMGVVIQPADKFGKIAQPIIDKSDIVKSKSIMDKKEHNSISAIKASDMISSIDRITNQVNNIEKNYQSKMEQLEIENSNLRNQIISLKQRLNSEMLNVSSIEVKLVKPEIEVSLPLEISSADHGIVEEVDPQTENISHKIKLKDFDEDIYIKGVIHYNNEQFDECIENLGVLPFGKGESRNATKGLFLLADSYEKIGRYKQALLCLEKLTSFNDPFYSELVLFKKGIIYRDIGMRDKAQKVFQTLVNFYPDSEYKAFAEQEIHNI
jgi:tetratricopeptide (TPR) repeat protein